MCANWSPSPSHSPLSRKAGKHRPLTVLTPLGSFLLDVQKRSEWKQAGVSACTCPCMDSKGQRVKTNPKDPDRVSTNRQKPPAEKLFLQFL